MHPAFTVRLRLHSGIPIVDVHGEWEPAATRALAEMLGALASAGHYEIVVNLQRAALDWLSALRSLSRVAETVRSHFGHIDLVAGLAHSERLTEQRMEHLFRVALSEESAISRIKRMPVLAPGPLCTSRPV